jgi:hypothetical protein
MRSWDDLLAYYLQPRPWRDILHYWLASRYTSLKKAPVWGQHCVWPPDAFSPPQRFQTLESANAVNTLAMRLQCRLLNKVSQYCRLKGPRFWHCPMIDLQHVLVLFKWLFQRLSTLSGKSQFGKEEYCNVVLQRRLSRNRELHIRKEVQDFLRMYFVLRTVLPKIIVS